MPRLAPLARRHRLALAAALALTFLPAVPPGRAGAGQGSATGTAPAATSAVASPSSRRPITEMDLMRFVWVADPRISPDGSRIAFVRVAVAEDREGYDTSLWIVPADGSEPARQFTSGRRDASPRWSPDGRWIAFTRAAEKEGKKGEFGPAQLYLIPAGGGEAMRLTDLPRSADAPDWSPDGRALVFTSTTSDRDVAKQKKQAEKEAEKEKSGGGDAARQASTAEGPGEERESDVRVITRAVYRYNGQGYLDTGRPAHLWTVAVPRPGASAAEPRRVTEGPFAEEDAAWSPDGSRLFFTSTRVAEPYYGSDDSDLFSVPAAGGEVRLEASIDGEIEGFAFSPDGRRIAFAATPYGKPERSYNQPDLFVVEARPGAAPRNLTAGYDYDVGAPLTGDQKPPRAAGSASVLWSADGRSLVLRTAERGRGNLMRFDAGSGRGEPLTRGDQEVVAYSASRDGSRLAMVVSNPVAIADLFALDVRGPGAGTPRRLTSFNDGLFSGLDLTPPVEIEYASFDGRKIQAWVQRPPDFTEGRKYPLILNIHGGPHATFGFTFDHEFQWMAAKGYVVLYANPRGSGGYGQEFGNVIQYHYPGDDHKDLMAGIDELIRRGWVDPDRLGVTGGSGGGVLTNWAITQTDRFKAAVSQRSIADWSAFWYVADFTQFTPSWFKAAPWEDPEDYIARSPITYAAKIKTPLMLMEGEADDRTPPGAGGEQMFRALKYLKRPVVMVRFPGETHEVSRSGKPWHRVERLQHLVGWFDKYLQGKDSGAYDVK